MEINVGQFFMTGSYDEVYSYYIRLPERYFGRFSFPSIYKISLEIRIYLLLRLQDSLLSVYFGSAKAGFSNRWWSTLGSTKAFISSILKHIIFETYNTFDVFLLAFCSYFSWYTPVWTDIRHIRYNSILLQFLDNHWPFFLYFILNCQCLVVFTVITSFVLIISHVLYTFDILTVLTGLKYLMVL